MVLRTRWCSCMYTPPPWAAAGADDKIMANWFPLALKPNTLAWLMNLPERSIRSWGISTSSSAACLGELPTPWDPQRASASEEGRDAAQLHATLLSDRPHHPLLGHLALLLWGAGSLHAGQDQHAVLLQSGYSRYDPIKTTTELYTMANKCTHAEEGRLALELI
jgi:hypothetical protein